MVICPGCQTEIAQFLTPENICGNCGFEAALHETIPVFAESYKRTFDDHTPGAIRALIEADRTYFWLRARRKIVTDAVKQHLHIGQQFLEIGAGSADIALSLKNWGIDATISDIQFEGLTYLAKERKCDRLVQFDIFHPVFKDHFNGVGAFDVLEHLDDDKTAVKNMLFSLLPGGLLFVTVPAHSWLWNHRDEAECHKRRYSKNELIRLFEGAGAKVLSARYIFFSILPLLVFRAAKDKIIPRKRTINRYIQDGFKINRCLNKLLLSICNLEIKLLKECSAPIGGSLFLIAQRPERKYD